MWRLEASEPTRDDQERHEHACGCTFVARDVQPSHGYVRCWSLPASLPARRDALTAVWCVVVDGGCHSNTGWLFANCAKFGLLGAFIMDAFKLGG